MSTINLFVGAVPTPLFRRLVRAARAVGEEGIEGGYTTTFWVPVGAPPTNVVEECLIRLHKLVEPGPGCIGMEWWLGRLRFGEGLRFHTDRDRSLRKATGQIVNPLWSSILYLNRFPGSPTVVLDQVLSADGKSWIPEHATSGRTLDAVPNHYVAFRGDLCHGVVAHTDGPGRRPSGLRLTLLVNYWDRRPMPPNCRDYDGSVYQAFRHEDAGAARVSGHPGSTA